MLFKKKTNRGVGVRSCGIFRVFTLPLEIPDKARLHPWKFHQTVLHASEILRPKTKTHGNST